MKIPAFQFYSGDWLKDPELRRCSHAAKGVWIDLLCLMSESEERGVLVTGGLPWSHQEMAQAVGGNLDTTIALIRELLTKGVARERSDGALFCARMVKDEAIRRTRQRVGRLGGNPALVKQPNNQSTEGEDEAHRGKGGAGGNGVCEPLEEIYSEYPLKVGKPAALKAIHAAIRRGYEPSLLLEKTSKYAQTVRNTDTILPHPSTWFNQDRFNDEPSTWVRHHVNGESEASLRRRQDQIKAHMANLKRRHFSDTQSLCGGQYLPAGWRDENAKAEYLRLSKESKSIDERIAKHL